MQRSVMLLAALSLGLAACGGPPQQEFGRAEAEAIRATIQSFVAAYNAKDVEKVASFFSGAGVLAPPNSSPIRGPESIKGYYQIRLFDQGATDLTIEVGDIGGHGPLGYVSASYTLHLRPPGGATDTRDRGKVLWILRNQGGQWRYEYQIWSSDLPPVAPAPSPAR